MSIKLPPVTDPPFCSQCGKRAGEHACGPTHAILFSEWLRADRRAVIEAVMDAATKVCDSGATSISCEACVQLLGELRAAALAAVGGS